MEILCLEILMPGDFVLGDFVPLPPRACQVTRTARFFSVLVEQSREASVSPSVLKHTNYLTGGASHIEAKLIVWVVGRAGAQNLQAQNLQASKSPSTKSPSIKISKHKISKHQNLQKMLRLIWWLSLLSSFFFFSTRCACGGASRVSY